MITFRFSAFFYSFSVDFDNINLNLQFFLLKPISFLGFTHFYLFKCFFWYNMRIRIHTLSNLNSTRNQISQSIMIKQKYLFNQKNRDCLIIISKRCQKKINKSNLQIIKNDTNLQKQYKKFKFIIRMSESFFETLSRVNTFTTGSWPYLDHKQLCPYNLAAGGYFVSRPFYLECHVCHNKVTIPQDFDADLSEAVEGIKKHKQNCIYFEDQIEGNPQKELSISKEEVYLLMDQFTIRLKQSSIALLQSKKYPVLDKQQIENNLAEDIFTFKSIDQAYKLNWNQQIKITFFFQFFGWLINKNQHHFNAECLFCGRKVSLEGKKMIDKNQQQKSQQYSQDESFSPVSEHRYFCLWVNPKCSGFKGYSIYLQYMFDKIVESKSLFPKRLPEETKKIRVEMDKYLESFQSKTSEQFDKIRAIFKECQGLRDSIQEPGQQGRTRMFQESENKMKQFVNDVLDQEMKSQIKKIKLN